jgi:hypothetical protein
MLIVIIVVIFLAAIGVFFVSRQKSQNVQESPSRVPQSGVSPLTDLESTAKLLLRQLKDAFKEWGTVKELSFEEVMKFFVAHKKDSEAIEKGAMLRQKNADGTITFLQVFLDKKNELVCKATGEPVGRKLTVVSLDSELLNTFKQHDLVIVS